MSATLAELDPTVVLRMVRARVRRRLPERRAGYEDDVVGAALLEVYEARHRGVPTSHRVVYVAVAAAIRSTFGDPKYRQPEDEQLTHDGAVDAIVGATQEDRTLCLRRLQQHYATLTDHQQAAVLALLTEEPLTDVAARLGTSMGSLSAARTTALRRLADPGAYSRIAVERRDPKLAARERAARYRARQRGAA